MRVFELIAGEEARTLPVRSGQVKSRLAADPDETHDLVEEKCDGGRAHALETKLCAICDPESVDARAKADQRRMAEFRGGPEKLRGAEQIFLRPRPGCRARKPGRLLNKGALGHQVPANSRAASQKNSSSVTRLLISPC